MALYREELAALMALSEEQLREKMRAFNMPKAARGPYRR
jgi:hypothetical protein